MAIKYLDFVSGNDSNDGSSWANRKLTFASAQTVASAGDEIRIAATTASAIVSNGTNFTWTNGLVNVTTASSQVGIIAAGDVIGRLGATGNGVNSNGTDSRGVACTESYYTVASVDAAKIVLISAYAGAGNVASVTESGCRRVVPVSTAGITCTKVLTISGGWVDATTQTGETWIKHSTPTSQVVTGFLSASSSLVSKVNVAGVLVTSGNNGAFTVGTFEDCTAICGNTATSNVFREAESATRCVVAHGYYAFQICKATTDCAVFSSVTGYYSSSASWPMTALRNASYTCGTGLTPVFAGETATSCYVDHCTVGFSVSTGKTSNCLAYKCPTGYSIYGSGFAQNCTANGSTTNGFTLSGYIQGCTTTNCTVGVAGNTGSTGMLWIQDHISISDTVGVSSAGYSQWQKLVNCSFTTPVNYAIDRTISSGPSECIGCTIDTPSLAKAYHVISGLSYGMPQFMLQNSFGKTGLIFANASTLLDKTTTPYSLQVVFAGTSGLQNAPLKVASLYGRASTALTIIMQYIAPVGTWSGTIVPLIKLNGTTIITGSTISTIDSATRTVTFSVTDGMMTTDGEVSVEIVPNSNNVGTNWTLLNVVEKPGQAIMYNGTNYWLNNDRPLEFINGQVAPVLGSFDGNTYASAPWTAFVS